MQLNRGFSLIELVVVITVMAIIAGAMIPTSVAILDIERAKATSEDITAIQTALQNYYSDVGSFPTNLTNLYTSPGSPTWHGPYLLPKYNTTDPTDNNVTHDRWRRAFIYRTIATNPPQFFIYSMGPNRADNNGQNDNTNAIDDISRTVLVTDVVNEQRRTLGKQQIAIFNAAIANYEKYAYTPGSTTPPVPAVPHIYTWTNNWPAAAQQLINRNMMSAVQNAANDPWGSPYLFNGTRVYSQNLP